ncbi:MAG: pilin [Patescibacteria group bacterium]|jgi:hypothetical protein
MQLKLSKLLSVSVSGIFGFLLLLTILFPSPAKAEVYYCCCGTSLLGYSDKDGNCYDYTCSGKMITTSSSATCGSGSDDNSGSAKFNPQITIPGSDFKQGSSYTINNNTAAIAQYIKAIYKYLIGIVGMVAAIMLMVGGIVWLTAGGSPERVKQAQEYIKASLTGLVLALGSFMILGLINPALVNFRISSIKTLKNDTSSSTSSSTTCCSCVNASWNAMGCSEGLKDQTACNGYCTGFTYKNFSTGAKCSSDNTCTSQ